MVEKSINSTIMESIQKYIEKISEHYKIEAIILFGSYAKGTENEDSDIDIAIISSDFSDIIEDGAKLIGLTWKMGTARGKKMPPARRNLEPAGLGALLFSIDGCQRGKRFATRRGTVYAVSSPAARSPLWAALSAVEGRSWSTLVSNWARYDDLCQPAAFLPPAADPHRRGGARLPV